jgi:hypothetical protein
LVPTCNYFYFFFIFFLVPDCNILLILATCNILLLSNFVKTMYIVLLIDKIQGFTYFKYLSFLNVCFEFKFNFHNSSSSLNSNVTPRF